MFLFLTISERSVQSQMNVHVECYVFAYVILHGKRGPQRENHDEMTTIRGLRRDLGFMKKCCLLTVTSKDY